MCMQFGNIFKIEIVFSVPVHQFLYFVRNSVFKYAKKLSERVAWNANVSFLSSDTSFYLPFLSYAHVLALIFIKMLELSLTHVKLSVKSSPFNC